MSVVDVLAAACYVVGAGFFVAGTVGILRFPDVYTRIHSLTKADGLGLGFVVAGLSVQAETLAIALKLWLIWALILIGSSISGQLIARSAKDSEVEPWKPR
jgi:multicomponent Na+:H+ antiporter subunit G